MCVVINCLQSNLHGICVFLRVLRQTYIACCCISFRACVGVCWGVYVCVKVITCVCVCVFLQRNVLVCPVEQNYIETRAPVSVQVPNDTERPRREQIALQLYCFAFHHFIHCVQRWWKEKNTLRANFTEVIKYLFFSNMAESKVLYTRPGSICN